MTAPIRAIETYYSGCRFRSRIEARWAVFFDRIGILWEHEEQGFDVGNPPVRYLPDFYLPQLGLYVEVKPAMADHVDPAGVARWTDFAGIVATEWEHGKSAIFMLVLLLRLVGFRRITQAQS